MCSPVSHRLKSRTFSGSNRNLSSEVCLCTCVCVGERENWAEHGILVPHALGSPLQLDGSKALTDTNALCWVYSSIFHLVFTPVPYEWNKREEKQAEKHHLCTLMEVVSLLHSAIHPSILQPIYFFNLSISMVHSFPLCITDIVPNTSRLIRPVTESSLTLCLPASPPASLLFSVSDWQCVSGITESAQWSTDELSQVQVTNRSLSLSVFLSLSLSLYFSLSFCFSLSVSLSLPPLPLSLWGLMPEASHDQRL